MKVYPIIPILIAALFLSACNDSDDGDTSSSRTELEGRWALPGNILSLTFSGNEYDLNIKEDPDIPGIDFCSGFDDIIEDPCSGEEISSSGKFSIGDSFENSRGETVKKITFTQELLNGESEPATESATYRKSNRILLYFGDKDGEMVDYPLYKK